MFATGVVCQEMEGKSKGPVQYRVIECWWRTLSACLRACYLSEICHTCAHIPAIHTKNVFLGVILGLVILLKDAVPNNGCSSTGTAAQDDPRLLQSMGGGILEH